MQKPYKNQESHIYHRNRSSVAPFFLGKEKSSLEQGGVCFPFPNIPQLRDRNNHDGQRRDKILCFFSPPGDRTIFSTYWGNFLTKFHRNLETEEKNPQEKFKKIQWRRRSKLQIPVPCRGRTHPDNYTPAEAATKKFKKYKFMAVGPFATANFAIFSFFPQFYSKQWPKRDVVNLPSLFVSFLYPLASKCAQNSSQSEILRKKAWDCNLGPFFVENLRN